MKQTLYSLVLAAALSVTAVSAAAAIPEKLYVFGNSGTIDGASINWSTGTAVPVADGIATVNIDGAKAGYSISTVGDTNDWGAINDNRVGCASTALADYGKEQDMAPKADVVFPAYEGDNYNVGNFSIIFDFNTDKVKVVPNTLYFIGDATNLVNGTAIDWNGTASAKAEDGWFTLNVDWQSYLTITPYSSGQTYGTGIAAAGAESNKALPADVVGKEMTAATGIHDVLPSEAGLYTIRISQDLKTIEYSDKITALYVFGYPGKINGADLSWDAGIAVPVVDGVARVNIDGAQGGYTISKYGYLNWGVIEKNKVSLPSTASDNYGVEQDIVENANLTFAPYEEDKYNVANYTITFDFNTGKGMVEPNALFLIGDPANTVDGTALNWAGDNEQPISVKAEDGFFTINIDWAGHLLMTPYSAGQVYAAGIGAAGMTTGEIMPVDFLGAELTAVSDKSNIQPPYKGKFTIKVSQDLKHVEYVAAVPRSVRLQVLDGYYGENPVYYDMTTENGYDYTYTLAGDDFIPQGRVISIVIPKEDNTVLASWRRNGTITDGEEEGWYTMGGETPSSMAAPFKGTVKAVIPSAENLSWDNPYWSDSATAKVTFEGDGTLTGIDGLTVDADSPAVYYDLQGRRVANPANGLYIERRGDKVRKIAL